MFSLFYNAIIVLLALLSSQLMAFHTPAVFADNEAIISLSSPLNYQITGKEITIENISLFPEYHHNWNTEQHLQNSFKFPGKALWLMTTIQNHYYKEFNGVVLYNQPLTEVVSFYALDKETKQIIYQSTVGSILPFAVRDIPFRSFAFPVNLKPEQSIEIYLRLEDQNNVYVDWDLYPQGRFTDWTESLQLYTGVIVGIAIALILLFIAGFYLSQNILFIHYSGFILGYLLFYSALNGVGFQFLWPNAAEVNQSAIFIFGGVTLLFLSLFAQKVLNYEEVHFIKNIYYVNTVLSLSIIFLPLYSPRTLSIPILTIIGLFILTFCLLISFYLVYKKVKQAKIFSLVWGLLFVSTLSLISTHYGLISSTPITEYFGFLGMLICTGLLIISFVKKIQQRYPRQQNKYQAVEALQQYYEVYKSTVEGIFTCSLNGQILYGNPTFVHVLGYKGFTELKNLTIEKGIFQIIPQIQKGIDIFEELNSNGFISNREVKIFRHDKRIIWILLSMRLSPSADNEKLFIHGAIIDITEKYQANEKLAYMVTHDPLTGALNRQEFEKQLKQLLNHRDISQPATLLFLDINRLKMINETCGHTAGDSLLRQMTDHIKSLLKDENYLARIGGDEFAILLEGSDRNEAFAIAYKLIESIQSFRFVWGGNLFKTGLSIGLADILSSDRSVEQVISKADTACYVAKSKGQSRIHIFSEEDKTHFQHKTEGEWIEIIKEAMENDKFCLFYQLIKPVKTDNEQALLYEVRLRIKNKDTYLSPTNFIPAAERFNLIQEIDRWVIEAYFEWLAKNPWHLDKLDLCFINLAGSSIANLEFHDFVKSQFHKYSIPFYKVCFELSEESAMHNLAAVHEFVNAFQSFGCKISLDDYGSGFSSYISLKNLPIDFIKVDGSYAKDLGIDEVQHAMVNSIITVTKLIGQQTIAEYVETKEIAEELEKSEVNYMQGRYIHSPEPLSQFIQTLPKLPQ